MNRTENIKVRGWRSKDKKRKGGKSGDKEEVTEKEEKTRGGEDRGLE